MQRKSARNVAIVLRHYRILSYNVSGHYRLRQKDNIPFLDLVNCRLIAFSIFSLFVIPILVPHDHEHEHGHEGHEHHISAANESENTTVPID